MRQPSRGGGLADRLDGLAQHGGQLHEYGIEQAVRDSRIAMIYEGTNEIQAIDVLQRKVLDDGGAGLDALLDRLAADGAAAPSAMTEFAQALHAQIDAVRAATAALRDGRIADPEWPLRVADDDLHGIGLTLLAWAWLRSAGRAGPCRQPLARRHAAHRTLWRAVAAAGGPLALDARHGVGCSAAARVLIQRHAARAWRETQGRLVASPRRAARRRRPRSVGLCDDTWPAAGLTAT